MRCPYCGVEIEDKERRNHISEKHPRFLNNFIERTFSEHFCLGCRWLIRIEHEVCPHCGYDLKKWRTKWAIAAMSNW